MQKDIDNKIQTNLQQLSTTKLIQCVQSEVGAKHQEYCRNFSVGTSLHALQSAINADPINNKNGVNKEENKEEIHHEILHQFFQALSHYIYMALTNIQKQHIINFKARCDFLTIYFIKIINKTIG